MMKSPHLHQSCVRLPERVIHLYVTPEICLGQSNSSYLERALLLNAAFCDHLTSSPLVERGGRAATELTACFAPIFQTDVRIGWMSRALRPPDWILLI